MLLMYIIYAAINICYTFPQVLTRKRRVLPKIGKHIIHPETKKSLAKSKSLNRVDPKLPCAFLYDVALLGELTWVSKIMKR